LAAKTKLTNLFSPSVQGFMLLHGGDEFPYRRLLAALLHAHGRVEPRIPPAAAGDQTAWLKTVSLREPAHLAARQFRSASCSRPPSSLSIGL